MKEKLIIKNFGPIKSVDLELGKMNILIGESASGKSTVAKVLAICRYFSYIVPNDAEMNYNFSMEFVMDYEFEQSLYDWGLWEFINLKSYWYYETLHYSLELKSRFDESKSVDVISFQINPLTPKFERLLKDYKDLKKNEAIDMTLTFLVNDAKPIMNYPFYFPTERGLQSIFSLGKSSIRNISDSLFNRFAELDSIARYFVSETYIEPLDLKYYNSNGKGYVKNLNQKDFTLLANGASGYQSTIPIVLVIKYFSERGRKSFIIEEPELNLYPKAQKKLVEFLTFSINDFDHQMLLTTHSPYILTALENLMYAYKMANIADGKYKEQVKEIVEEKYWINPEDVNVYFLGKDGEVDLMDREEVLINKEYIDSVSSNINEQYDKLLAIEVAYINESE